MRTQATLLCPTCADVLLIEKRHGVEIDICPTCRGVWLDRDELDKLLAVSGRMEEPRPGKRRDDDDDYEDDEPRLRRKGKNRRMTGWDLLKEILD